MEALEWFFVQRDQHHLTMESLYRHTGLTRQGFHQYRTRKGRHQDQHARLVDRVKQYRLDHPRLGARPLYVLMCQSTEDQSLMEGIGRDQFEQILLQHHLRVQPIRVFHRTTYKGPSRFANLCEGLCLNRINQVWVSDITYYRLNRKWAYLTFILDLYSKRCVAYQLSENLLSENTTIPALQMALNLRAVSDYQHQLIFHSDAGGQYQQKDFIGILRQHQIKSSMSESVYENPHVERFHSTAKNDYLIPWGVNSMSSLQIKLPKFIQLYNHIRPHSQLKNMTPVAFEKYIQQIPMEQRPIVLFKKLS